MNFYTAIFHVLLSIFKYSLRSEDVKVFGASELLSFLVLLNVATLVADFAQPFYLVIMFAALAIASIINYFLFVHHGAYKVRIASLDASSHSESLSLAAIFYIIISIVLFLWF